MKDKLVFSRDVKVNGKLFSSGTIVDSYSYDEDSDGYRRKFILFIIGDRTHYMNSSRFMESTCTISEYMHYKLSKLI